MFSPGSGGADNPRRVRCQPWGTAVGTLRTLDYGDCMYTGTLSAIADAADFFNTFRQMPRKTQDAVRQYLAPPLKTALAVIDSCGLEGQTVPEIAVSADLNRESVRSILKALEDKVVVSEMVGGYKVWRLKLPT
jgi:hypothetical protein